MTSRILDEEFEESTPVTHLHGRRMVSCGCSDCKGNLVDIHTKIIHEIDADSADNRGDNPLPSLEDNSISIDEDSEDNRGDDNPLPSLEDNPISIDEDSEDDVIQRMEAEEKEDLPTTLHHQHRSRRYVNQQTTITGQEVTPELLFISDEELNTSYSENENNSDDNDDNKYNEIFEDYSPPDYEPFQDQTGPETTTNSQFLWILLWIMNFRRRFNISETATESLIKFIKLLLTEIGGSNFNEFPGSLYLVRNVLGLKDQHHSFVACPKCHKLYNKKDVEEYRQDGNYTIIKCNHIEFSNSMVRRSKRC